MVQRRDDDERTPPSDPNRRDSSAEFELVLRKTAELIRVEGDAREKRNRDRARFSTEQIRATRALTEKVSTLDARVSELFTRDAVDVVELKALEEDLKELKVFWHSKIGDVEGAVRELTKSREQMAGAMSLAWKVVTIGGAIVGAAAAFVSWLLQQLATGKPELRKMP
jgi:hypothetical protein